MDHTCITCLSCGHRRLPVENNLPPHPLGVDKLGLQINAAVIAGRLRWSDVSRSTSMTTGDLSDLLQGRSLHIDADDKEILRAMLKDCGI